MVASLYVGTPENDKLVTVETSTTTLTVLFKDNNIKADGTVQINGRAIAANQFGSTLEALGVMDKDCVHVVRKLANA